MSNVLLCFWRDHFSGAIYFSFISYFLVRFIVYLFALIRFGTLQSMLWSIFAYLNLLSAVHRRILNYEICSYRTLQYVDFIFCLMRDVRIVFLYCYSCSTSFGVGSFLSAAPNEVPALDHLSSIFSLSFLTLSLIISHTIFGSSFSLLCEHLLLQWINV